MNSILKIFVVLALSFLTFIIFNDPGPVWFFPLFLVALLFKDFFAKFRIMKGGLALRYVCAGVFFGLLIEFLAILSSQGVPAGQRALFHQEPIPDMILAFGYYALIMVGSYMILKKYDYSLKEFFVFGGIFGILLEEHGKVLLQVLAGNILGGIYVFLSYSSLLALPYVIFNEDFKRYPRKSSILKYPVSLLMLIVFYLFFLGYFLLVNPLISI
ncbi:hypothetical protein KY358_06620 [Candidatus Woesearchaeota archaeon]|nr:hypothetical protein [Candidatus Woesearchaeota archaeon]